MYQLKTVGFFFLVFIGLAFLFPRTTLASSSLRFLHQDHLGSTVLVTDDQGTIVSQQNYYPYGSVRNLQGSLPTEKQYTGQVSDKDETGLYYYNARYYSPKIGKFTSADVNVGPNRYLYVGNNPVRFNDPSGHESEETWQNWWASSNSKPSESNSSLGLAERVSALPYVYRITATMIAASVYENMTGSYENLENASPAVQIGLSIASEPVDWALTISDWKNGDFHWSDLLGLAPIIPHAGIGAIRKADPFVGQATARFIVGSKKGLGITTRVLGPSPKLLGQANPGRVTDLFSRGSGTNLETAIHEAYHHLLGHTDWRKQTRDRDAFIKMGYSPDQASKLKDVWMEALVATGTIRSLRRINMENTAYYDDAVRYYFSQIGKLEDLGYHTNWETLCDKVRPYSEELYNKILYEFVQ
jgi:RHS repeat-associated protein